MEVDGKLRLFIAGDEQVARLRLTLYVSKTSVNLQRNFLDCKVKKCLTQSDEGLNECLQECGRPLEYQ